MSINPEIPRSHLPNYLNTVMACLAERPKSRRERRLEESNGWGKSQDCEQRKRGQGKRRVHMDYGMRKGGPDNLLGHSHTKTHVLSTNCVGRISACGGLLSLPLPHFYMFFMVNFISPPLHLNLSLFILCQTSCIKCTQFHYFIEQLLTLLVNQSAYEQT